MKTLALLLSLVAFATVRADDIPPNVSNPLDPNEYGCDSQINDQVIYDPFQLNSQTTLNIATWEGQFSSGLTGNGQAIGTFTLGIFADNPNAPIFDHTNPSATMDGPGALLMSVTGTVTGTPLGIADPLQGGNISTWQLAFSDVVLAAGNYWFSVAAASSTNTYYIWNHSTAPGPDTVLGGATITSNPSFMDLGAGVPDGRMAYTLGDPPSSPAAIDATDTVNAPDGGSTLALLAAGIMWLGLVRHRLSPS